MSSDKPPSTSLIVRNPVQVVRRGLGPKVDLLPNAPLLAQGRAGGLVRTRAYWWAVGGQLVAAAALVAVAIAAGSPGPVGGIIGLTAGAVSSWRAFHDRWLRSRFEKLPLTEDPKPEHVGGLVRVCGKVLEGGHFQSPGSPKGVVLGRFLGRTSVVGRDGLFRRSRSVEELRGVNFRVQTALGRELLVKVERAFLISRDQDFCNHQHIGRPIDCQALDTARGVRITELLREEIITAGDVVEVVGVLGQDIDPNGSRSELRSPPMLLTLSAGELVPVLVREVEVDEAAV